MNKKTHQKAREEFMRACVRATSPREKAEVLFDLCGIEYDHQCKQPLAGPQAEPAISKLVPIG